MSKFYNINIEKAILNTILFNPAIFEEVINKLNSDDFYLPFHKHLFETIEELEEEEEPIDEDFLKKRLEKANRFDEEKMIEIMTTTPLANLSAYINELKEYSIKRKLKNLTIKINNNLEAEEKSEKIIEKIEKELEKIENFNSTEEDDFTTIGEITEKTINDISKRNGITGLKTGFKTLDFYLNGLEKGDLIIIGARPSVGKSAFMLNIADNISKANYSVGIISLEMTAKKLTERLLAINTGVELNKIKNNNLHKNEWNTLEITEKELKKRKLYINDNSNNTTIQNIKRIIKKLTKKTKIDLIIIDYLQLIEGNKKERHLEIGEISRKLKLLAKELNIPIILLSQLNRALENRINKKPMLSDLRESGNIEQDADKIILLYTPTKTNEELNIAIEKNRDGETEEVILKFEKKYQKISEYQNITFNTKKEKKKTKIYSGL